VTDCMDLFLFPHLAPSRATTHVALFLNVKNASYLRKRIVSAVTMGGEIGETEREQVNYAFIDARLVSPSLHFYVSQLMTITELRSQAVVICRLLFISPFLRRLITDYEHELFIPKFFGI